MNDIGKFQYNEKYLWLVAYPLIALSYSFFANDNDFFHLISIPSFYSDVIFALILTFGVGYFLKIITTYLDKKYNWLDSFKERLTMQLLLGVLSPLIVSLLMEVGYLRLIDIPLTKSSILHLELPLSFLFLLLINAFYTLNYLYFSKKISIEIPLIENVIPPPQIHKNEYIEVQKGYKAFQISITNCAYLVSENKTIWLHTYEKERFYVKGTLEEWELRLKEANFYRINRQYLVSHAAIDSVEQTETRKLKVNFVIPAEKEAFVSKPNATAFKQWWKSCPS